MKKLTAFVMIVCMGMFCSLGCSKPAQDKEPPAPPPAEGEKEPAGDVNKAPAAPEEGKEVKEGEKAPAETPAPEKTEEPAPEKPAEKPAE